MELIQETDRSKSVVHGNHSMKCFTKGDIDRMTNNYRTSLGSGAFGEVYEGVVLEDGSKVAVKKFMHNVQENFTKELIVHREINHKNVVRLIGCCVEENALMLQVTEYIPNGNLSDALHRGNRPIPLDVRLSIAIEYAEAFMHSHMYTQVIHGDIKPANILLDENFHAKLSDFGISRLVNTDKTLHTKNVVGSIGYMDPLFTLDGLLTVKYDVYSFGVVLLELIARKKATTVVDNVNIVSAFTNALANGIRGVRGMFDSEIVSKSNMKILKSVAKLAGECLMMERDKRPEMIDVAERLRVLWKASHQDQGHQGVDLFSWVRKSKPSTASTIPAKIFPSDLCRQFSFAEMKAATNNFDKSLIIGYGGLGRLYLGKIDGAATMVAVKQVRDICYFQSLIDMMSKLRHGNLVPLIGYCHKKKRMLLVYEYMARGSLREHLYGTEKPPLSWKQRVEACICASRGLRYLHELQVIHGDVRAANIRLDEEWLAKITDLALPPNVSSSTHLRLFYGTFCYLDPEYLRTCQFTEKSDVYSFGVVLLEVLCARPAYIRPLRKEQTTLVAWALRCKEEGSLDQIVDPQCLDKFVETAERCLAPKSDDRPSMGDVVSELEYALHLQVSAEARQQ
ncbi:unnamed protein product [Urochloa humidicola]